MAVVLGFMLVLAAPVWLRHFGGDAAAWTVSFTGRATMDILRGMPYAALGLSALWAARIANAPVFVLSLILIPSQYYFSGGTAAVAGGDQMRFVLFLILPLLVTGSQFVSHRNVACTFKVGLLVLLIGFLIPPLISVSAGRWLSTWAGSHRWTGASFLGAPSLPTVFYLILCGINLLLPFQGREGEMKKLMAALIPCFYFSGVFQPIFQSGPLYPPPVQPVAFVVCTALASLILLYCNFFLSWSKAYVDDLTQVLGRRALNEALARLSGNYAIAMVDIDHFKKFNDTYGHAAGDEVLREVAALLSASSAGQVYRYGGEEFSVLYSNTAADLAAERMEETRRALAETKIPLNGSAPKKREKKVTVHISVGVSEQTRKNDTPEKVLRAADAALYRAKEGGRNRVEKG